MANNGIIEALIIFHNYSIITKPYAPFLTNLFLTQKKLLISTHIIRA